MQRGRITSTATVMRRLAGSSSQAAAAMRRLEAQLKDSYPDYVLVAACAARKQIRAQARSRARAWQRRHPVPR